MLHPLEWPLFARHLIYRRPWLTLWVGFELTGLVFRRLTQRARLRFQSDPHQGIKKRPKWLKPACSFSEPKALDLPTVVLAGRMPIIPAAKLPDGDPETVYQFHRWSSCVTALGDDVLTRIALDRALDWIKNPPPRNHPAWEPYSASERVANLAFLLAAHPSLRVGLDEKLVGQFFCDSASWIDAHLEYYGEIRTNNHLLNNGRALLLAGRMTGCQAWVDTGLTIFRHLCPLLFPKDGCLREGSSHYQLIVSGWLFDVLVFANWDDLQGERQALESCAEKAALVCASLVALTPKMDVHIGDISPDLHPKHTLARMQIVYPQRLEVAVSNRQLGDWLFTARGEHSVLARIPDRWPVPYATHAHEDFGSVLWLYGGKTILADPGRFCYSPLIMEQDQVGPNAHNVLVVNDRGALASSVLNNGIWYPRPYATASIKVQVDPDGFSVTHDGYSRMTGLGTHTRAAHLRTWGLEVIDQIEGRGLAEIALVWHFAPDYLRDDGLSLTSAAGRLQVHVDQPNGHTSWWTYINSSAYGEATPATGLTFTWKIELPFRIRTHFLFQSCVE